jgi:hypothetical protein
MTYDHDTAASVSTATFAPLSDSGARPPQVHFRVHEHDGRVMLAEPPGATIRCELLPDLSSSVVIREAKDDLHIANIAVYDPSADDITAETIAIASAIYWSWWRAEDMHGRTHRYDGEGNRCC